MVQRPNTKSSPIPVFLIVSILVIVIIGIWILRVKITNPQINQDNNATISAVPAATDTTNNTKLEKDIKEIEGSLNKIDAEQNNLEQGITGQ